jgi:predicted amidohydrolase
MTLSLALAQFAIAPADPERNLRRMEDLIRKAAKRGAQLVVFPEDAVSGPLHGQTGFVAQAPSYLAHFQGLAVKYGVDLVPGSWTVQDGPALYNTAHYINADGSLAGSYRKINLWETEKAAIAPGSAPTVFPTRFGRVGLIICWDLSFPPLFTAMNAQGVELVIAPAYWSFTVPSKAVKSVKEDEVMLIDSLCTARAFENNIVLAYCNAAGALKAPGMDAVLSGRSQVTHPVHKVVAQADGNAEELLMATVELVHKA